MTDDAKEDWIRYDRMMNKNERYTDEMSEFWLDDWHQNILCLDQDQLDGIRGSIYVCLGQNTYLISISLSCAEPISDRIFRNFTRLTKNQSRMGDK